MSESRPNEEDVIPAQRYTRIKLASPSPKGSSDSETESIHSCQGYNTELARDTSDTSTTPNSTPYQIEYEITEPEVPNRQVFFSESDDEDNDILNQDIVLLPKSDSGTSQNGLLGDTSEENSTSPTSNSDVDPGLPRNDYVDFEKCLLCGTVEKDVSYPYCTTCFTMKKNMFPSRPKRRRKCFKKNSHHLKTPDISDNFQISKDMVSGNSKSQGEGSVGDGLYEDSGVEGSGSQVSEDTVDGPSQPSCSASNVGKLTLGICEVCFQRPANGLFLHLTLAHCYGCYHCANKIWNHSGCCPICRRKVCKVARLYV